MQSIGTHIRFKEKSKIKDNNQSGITLVALVVTIVVLIILAGISIMYTLGDKSIIRKAQEAKNKTEEAVDKEKQEVEDLWNELEESNEGREIQIKVNVKSFNATLGEFPVVYKIVGKKDGTVVYEEMVLTNVKNAGTENMNITVNVPEESMVTVEEVYCGANYTLTSGQRIEKVVKPEAITEFTFEHEYNYKMIHNTGIKI